MIDIKDLEKQLEIAKKEKYIQDKTNWHKETKEFLDSIINKALIFEYSNKKYSLFKVIKYKRCSWYMCDKLEDFYETYSKGYYRLERNSIMTELSTSNFINPLVEVKKRKSKNIIQPLHIQYWNDTHYQQEFTSPKKVGYEDNNGNNYIGKIPPSVKEEFWNCWFAPDEVFNEIERIRINTEQQLLDLYKKNENKLMLQRLVTNV